MREKQAQSNRSLHNKAKFPVSCASVEQWQKLVLIEIKR